MKGTYKARAKEWGLGHAGTGAEQVAVLFEFTQGELAGRCITWYGYFSDATVERTLDSLRHCGWDGHDFVNLDGLDRNEVDLVIDEEEGQDGKVYDRVKWVNRPARLALRTQMNHQEATSFAQRMKGKALQHAQKYGKQPAATTSDRQQQRQPAPRDQMDPDPSWQPPTDDDIPY